MEGRSGGQLELVSPFARGFYLTDPVAEQTWYVGIVVSAWGRQRRSTGHSPRQAAGQARLSPTRRRIVPALRPRRPWPSNALPFLSELGLVSEAPPVLELGTPPWAVPWGSAGGRCTDGDSRRPQGALLKVCLDPEPGKGKTELGFGSKRGTRKLRRYH